MPLCILLPPLSLYYIPVSDCTIVHQAILLFLSISCFCHYFVVAVRDSDVIDSFYTYSFLFPLNYLAELSRNGIDVFIGFEYFYHSYCNIALLHIFVYNQGCLFEVL